MLQVRRLFLCFLSLIIISCVTNTINSDGTVQSSKIDADKLSDTYVDLAIEYQQRGAPQVALDRVNLAITTNSDNAKAYMIRAMIYQNLGQNKDAEKDFKKAIRIGDNYSEAYVNYAVFLCDQKRFPEAVTVFDTALSNPLYYTPEIAYYSRGNCYYKNGALESANADYLRSLSYRNSPQDAYIALAKLQLDKKNYQLSDYYIKKFNGTQTPDSLWLHIQILQALIDHTNNPKERMDYTSYRNTMGKVLISNYGDSSATQEYLLRYGNGKEGVNLQSGKPVSPVMEPKSVPGNSVNPGGESIAVVNSARKYVIVQPGDTLYSISRKSLIPIGELKRINALSNDRVEIGSKLYLN